MDSNTKTNQLVGTSNFIEWNRIFTRGAKDKDVWSLLKKEWIPMTTEPNMDDEKYQSQTAVVATPTDTITTATRRTVGNRELAGLGLETPSTPTNTGSAQIAGTSIILPDTTPFAKFQHDHAQYEKGQKKIKLARTLIKNSVSPIIAGLIRNKDDPVEAYEFLIQKYKVSNTTARQKLFAQLKNTTLNKFKFNVENYVNKIFETREDLLDYDRELTDDEVAEYLLAGLPDSYKDFKEKYEWLLRYQGTPDQHDLQALTDELLKEGARRDEAFKAKKSKSNKGNGSGTNDGDNNSKNRENTNPVCEECGKRHPGKCWKTNPELMPEHIKKKIEQAKSSSKSQSKSSDKPTNKTDSTTKRFAGLTVADVDSGMNLPKSPSGIPADSSSTQILKNRCVSGDGAERDDQGDDYREIGATQAFKALVAGTVQDKDTWLLDSGCNVHIVNDMKWFTTFSDKKRGLIGTADRDISLSIKGGGRAIVECSNTNNESYKMLLRHVLYAPSARCNLLSVSTLLAEGKLTMKGDSTGMMLYENKKEVGRAQVVGNLYRLNVHAPTDNTIKNQPFAAVIDFEHPVWKWHRRLGHLGLQNMRNLIKISDGVDLTDQQIKNMLGAVCPVCATTRALVHIPRDPAKRRAKEPGMFMHVDTWGKYAVEGWDGTFYFLFITDDATRYTWCARYAEKKDLSRAFQQLHREIETSLNIKIRNYRLDGEFVEGPIGRWLRKKTIGIEVTQPYAHYQNGAAERPNRTIREKGAAMIQEDDVIQRLHDITVGKTQELLRETNRPENLWPEAVEHAVWLKNRSPARALRKKEKKTPWHALFNTQPSLDRERIWGSRYYVTYPPELRNAGYKLHEPRGWLGYWVGRFSESVDRIFSPEKHKVFKIGVARIEDGQGLRDPQPEATYEDRVPTPEVEIPENEDVESGSESGDDHLSDDDMLDTPAIPGSDGNLSALRETPQSNDEVNDRRDKPGGNQGESLENQVAKSPTQEATHQENETAVNRPQTGDPILEKTPNDNTGLEWTDVYDDDADELSGDDEIEMNEVSKYFANLADEGDESDFSVISEMSSTDEEEPVKKKVSKAGNPLRRENKRSSRRIHTPAGAVLGPLHTLKPDPTRCDRCFRSRRNCDRDSSKDGKCTGCRTSGCRCIDQTKELKALIPEANRAPALKPDEPAPPPKADKPCRKCYTTGAIYRFKPGSTICMGCTRAGRKTACEMNLEGALSEKERKASKKGGDIIKPGVPKEQKCERCLKLGKRCNGETPCNQCIRGVSLRKRCTKQTGNGGIPKDQQPSCLTCYHETYYCDKGTPCGNCTRAGVLCTYIHEGGMSTRSYPTKDDHWRAKDKNRHADECVRCLRKRLNCNGEHPCYRCVKDFGKADMRGEGLSCTYYQDDNSRDAYLINPYTLDNEGRAVLKKNWEAYIPESRKPHNTAKEQRTRLKSVKTREHVQMRDVRSQAGVLFGQAFPNGYEILRTPSDGLLCMVFAIVIGMLEQHATI